MEISAKEIMILVSKKVTMANFWWETRRSLGVIRIRIQKRGLIEDGYCVGPFDTTSGSGTKLMNIDVFHCVRCSLVLSFIDAHFCEFQHHCIVCKHA